MFSNNFDHSKTNSIGSYVVPGRFLNFGHIFYLSQVAARTNGQHVQGA